MAACNARENWRAWCGVKSNCNGWSSTPASGKMCHTSKWSGLFSSPTPCFPLFTILLCNLKALKFIRSFFVTEGSRLSRLFARALHRTGFYFRASTAFTLSRWKSPWNFSAIRNAHSSVLSLFDFSFGSTIGWNVFWWMARKLHETNCWQIARVSRMDDKYTYVNLYSACFPTSWVCFGRGVSWKELALSFTSGHSSLSLITSKYVKILVLSKFSLNTCMRRLGVVSEIFTKELSIPMKVVDDIVFEKVFNPYFLHLSRIKFFHFYFTSSDTSI